MFRAIKDYDGSESSKCIDLQIGDNLGAVHALDEIWFIGYNNRTGETGAFPIECVEDVQESDSNDEFGANGGQASKQIMYANVSASIQKRKDSQDLSPIERSRTLSNKANKLDAKRPRTKPEIQYRLKLVKKNSETTGTTNSEDKGDNDTKNMDVEDAASEPQTVDHSEIFTVKPSEEAKSSTLQRVRFSSVALEHSVSVPESTDSWQDLESSVEISGTWSPPEDGGSEPTDDRSHGNSRDNASKSKPKRKDSDGKYHKFDKIKAIKDHSYVLQVLQSNEDENKGLKAVFGALAGLLIGALLFLVLVFSFDYTELQAGIIVAISTITISLCLAFSTLCRCIMALIFPNFFTGKGRTVFLSIIFGVLLSKPVANITNNAKETGKSFSCMTELARNQTAALQRQLAQPVEELMAYVEDQNRNLRLASHDISEAFDEGSGEINQGINTAQGSLNNVIQQCKGPVKELINQCRKICNLPFIGDRCGECNKFSPLAANCDQLNILHSEINQAADKVKDKFTEAMKYFTVDVKLTAEIHGESNTTKSVEMIQDEVNEDITSKAQTFEVFLSILKKGLSLSIALLFFQSFWYLRNYLAKDDYDNIYITSQFKELDKNLEREGGANVLPLKTKEKSIYVDPSSFRLNETELSYCKIGLAQVLLHFILCFLLLIFDFALYYILNLVRKYGDVEVQVEGGGHFIVSVEGNGPVALFYGTLIQGINLRSNYSASLEIGSCLPNPNAPSVAIIPVLIILYLIALCFVLLRGYGMRLRRKIAAYYYPKQEKARMEYLHKKIRHKRAGLLKMIRQLIKSSHKETAIKDKLRLSTWLAFKLPIIGRFFLSNERLICTSCEHTESTFNNIKLSKCKGRPDGIACDAVYCEECWVALNHSCPICTSSDEVALRE